MNSVLQQKRKFETIRRYLRLTLWPYGIWHHVIWLVATDFSEKPDAYFLRVERKLYSPLKLSKTVTKYTASHPIQPQY
jgi:hypothetical protein